MEKFKGLMFHTARWDHSYDYKGKKMAVVENGCSAAQVVPTVAEDAASVKQYARSSQWYHERPNRYFTKMEKLAFHYLPLWERWKRLRLFLENDDLVATYMPGLRAGTKKKKVEDHAKEYILSKTPEKYHHFIVPDFPLGKSRRSLRFVLVTYVLGCKRRIFDPNYLDSLNASNVEVIPESIRGITEKGIITENGKEDDFDVIVLATGFKVQQFVTPMEIVGKEGKSLNQQWKEHRGAQAYMGSYVHNFPNLVILYTVLV
ncbi:hypothetical protein N0V90_010026 [Kalmusia sp. IMI 367209]|nr:hypothetical protein N0V90_010026 [Kalmusia sp. IMI 367209]